MRVPVLRAPMPECIHVHVRLIERQVAQDELVVDAGDTNEMTRHDGQQIRIRDHAPRGEELVDRDRDSPLAPERPQRLVDEAMRAA